MIAYAQALQGAVDLLEHDPRCRHEALGVEHRQQQPPRAVVIGVVGRDEPVAQQRDKLAVHSLAPMELLRIGDEQEVLGLGPQHDDAEPVEEADGEDRAVLLVGGQEHRQGVAHEAQVACGADSGWARRQRAPA